MNLSITGHHLDVTPAIKEYVQTKMARVLRHFDHVIDTQVMLSVEPLKHHAEITLHKIDRKVLQYKSRTQDHTHVAVKRQTFEAA